jgi:hypothetical protein
MAFIALPLDVSRAAWKQVGLLAGLLVCLAQAGLAEEVELAWKLKAGDRFKVTRLQQTVSHTSVASKPVRTSVATTVAMTWNVDSVDDKGEAAITQSLDQISVTMDAGNGVVIFDSSAVGKPTGVVKTLADGVAPFLGEKFTVTMSRRGEITALQPSDKLAKLFQGNKEEAGGMQGFSLQGVAKLLQQPLILLPEDKVSEGSGWEAQRDLPSALGTLKQTLTYKFAGFGDQKEAKIARIELSGTIAAPKAAAPDAPKLKASELTGTAQFDSEAGRLVEMTARQTLELTTVYANTPLSVKTESQVTTKLTPP